MSRLFDALDSIEKRESAESEGRLPSFSNPCSSTAPSRRHGLLLLVAGVLIMVLASAAWVFFMRHGTGGPAGPGIPANMASTSILQNFTKEMAQASSTRQHETARSVKQHAQGPAMPLNHGAAGPSASTDTLTKETSKEVSQKISNEISHNREKRAHEPPARTSAMTSNRDTGKDTHTPKHQQDRNSAATSVSSWQKQRRLKTFGIFSADVKRMLQQAEELQNSGDIRQAADIYENLWDNTQSPLIANNLAACLIVCGRLQEAKAVLKSALKITPHDPDLLYNLSLVQSR